MKVSDWRGQEEDLAWDIVQESIRKVIEYMKKTDYKTHKNVHSLDGLLITTIWNYSTDLYRSEKKLRRETSGSFEEFCFEAASDEASFSDVATENVYRERLFCSLARAIVRFPRKQRLAVLADLASRMSFRGAPTILQRAFLNEGINLKEYQSLQIESTKQKNRNAALLNYAYKRLKNLIEVKEYLDEG